MTVDKRLGGSHRLRAARLRWLWLPLVLVVLGMVFAYAVLNTHSRLTGDGERMANRNATNANSSDAATVCARATIGSAGGSIGVKDAGTPADGLSASVPAGALEWEEEISLGYTDRSVRIRAGTGSGKVLFLRTQRASSFEQPVVLQVPLDGKLFSDLAIPYEVDAEGKLHVMDIKSIDGENLRLRFYTFKPCMFTWVYP